MRIIAEPRSDQWNADDFAGGPRTFTIAGVVPGKAEQKYDIQLAGESRVWRPPLTMLRVLVALWSDEAADWTGRQVTLFNDPSIRFGPEVTGGIRISHMSHIDGPQTVRVTTKRGKRAPYSVEPLVATVNPIDALGQALTGSRTLAELQAAWGQVTAAGHGTNPVLVAAKDARKTELAGDTT